MKSTRRGFCVGCSTAIASLAGSRFNSLAFGGQAGINDDILLVIFLRGGIDGLNLVPPTTHPDRQYYEIARNDIQVPLSGSFAALDVGGGFGLHRGAQRLHELYQDGNVAIVQATGMTTVSTRSHFDAMEFMELGTPGSSSSSSGWLARHLSTATNLPTEVIMPSLAVGSLEPTSLLGSEDTASLGNVNNFSLQMGPGQWRSAHRTALRQLINNGSTGLHFSCGRALDAVDIVELNVDGGYTPENGAQYPSGSFGNNLRAIAQIIKIGLGLRIATLDLGGWDTHNGQGNDGGGFFFDNVEQLSEGLHAFYTDMDGGGGTPSYNPRITTVVMSEFGRRLRENANNGTDHGSGNNMLVIGGSVNGGLYGNWPGIADEQLFDNADLAVTTDYRQVLTEILVRRLNNTAIGTIFPGYVPDYQNVGPLGVVEGPDLVIDSPAVFEDGFENGTVPWTLTQTG